LDGRQDLALQVVWKLGDEIRLVVNRQQGEQGEQPVEWNLRKNGPERHVVDLGDDLGGLFFVFDLLDHPALMSWGKVVDGYGDVFSARLLERAL
jgi:hypothetical protein